jgi:hypothetical protein
MARNDDDAERRRAEAIDAEYEEPGYRSEPRGIGAGSAVALAILAAGVGAAGGAVAPRVAPVNAALDAAFPGESQTAEPVEASSDVDQRLASIEQLLNAPLAYATSDEAGDAGTAARVFALQSGLRDVEARLSAMPSNEQVNALIAEVRALQEELPAIAEEARAAAIAARASYAVVAASEAAGSSGPFVQAHTALAALLPEDANVAALEPLARVGAPTRSELKNRFAELDNEIIRTAHQAQAGAGFWGRVQATLAQWIVIRRSGAGDTPEGIVARAEAHLAGNRLREAIQELNRLPEAPKRVAQPWINDATRRLEIDERIVAIRTELSRS